MLKNLKKSLTEPPKNCHYCPRLKSFRTENKNKYPKFYNAPVKSFGLINSDLLIVGLAPGLNGANKTGRPFTGDFAGKVLYPALIKSDLARGIYEEKKSDNIELLNCRITNAVRCVPPQNKPQGIEIRNCQVFLNNEINCMKNIKGILALGVVAHNSILSIMKVTKNKYKFKHGKIHQLSKKLWIANSYHCSRYNINTGRLTVEQFEKVIMKVSNKLNTF